MTSSHSFDNAKKARKIAAGPHKKLGDIERSKVLLNQAQMLRNVLENFPGVVFWKDCNSVYLGCNKAFAFAAGLADPAEIAGKSDYDLPWAGTEADAYRADDRRVIESGMPRLGIIETQLQADGRVAWFDTNKVPLFDDDGKVIGVLGTSNDITGRKQTEEALRESELKYRRIVDLANEGIWMQNRDARTDFVNVLMAEMLGYSPEEMIGQPVEDFMFEEDVADHQRRMEARRGGKAEHYERRYRHRDGRAVWTLISATPIFDADNRFKGAFAMLTDITRRKEMEYALKESEERLNEILQGSPIPQFVIDKNHHVIYWNRAMEKHTGLKAGDIVGTNRHWQAVYVKQRPSLVDLLLDGQENRIPELYGKKCSKSKLIEGAFAGVDFFSKLGEKGKWLLFTATVLKDSAGNTIGGLETLEDITEQIVAQEALKRAHAELEIKVRERTADLVRANETLKNEIGERRQSEEARRKTEQQLADIIQHLPDATFVVDKERKLIAWNKAIEVMTGTKAEDVLGKGDYEYAIPFYGCRRPVLIDYLFEKNREFTEKAYADFKNEGNALIAEATVTMPGGRVAVFWAKVTPLYEKNGELIGAIESIKDITELRQIQREKEAFQTQMIQSSKMAAVGQMAAGVAHEINNPLTIILGNVQLLLNSRSPVETTHGILSEVERATQRCKKIVSDLLEFSRNKETELQDCSINEVIEHILHLSSFQDYFKIMKIEKKYARDLPAVKAHVNRIGQVFLNLIANAAQAMHGEGRLTIATRCIPEKQYVEISFADIGEGISPENLSHVFEPFFTTKAKGTGLGLSVCYNIIKQHGGDISVTSPGKGKGATFTVVLPFKGGNENK